MYVCVLVGVVSGDQDMPAILCLEAIWFVLDEMYVLMSHFSSIPSDISDTPWNVYKTLYIYVRHYTSIHVICNINTHMLPAAI